VGVVGASRAARSRSSSGPLTEIAGPAQRPEPDLNETFATFFRLTGSGFQVAILVLTVAVATVVSRPFCHTVCPVDTTEQLARFVRVRVRRLIGRERVQARPPRPVLLPMARTDHAAVDPLRRVRNGLLTAVGLLCALLVLGHLYSRFSGQSLGVQENLMSDTFLTLEEK